MKFVDLFYIGKGLPAVEWENQRQKAFEQEFASIAKNRMSLWQPNNDFSQIGKRFLLGIFTWNYYDFYLLDCINNSLIKKSTDEFFEILDIDNFTSLEELQSVFGDSKPDQSPILGIWEDGILSKTLWSWDTRNFLIEKFDFKWQPPKYWLNPQ